MTRYAVTGSSRDLTQAEKMIVTMAIARLSDIEEFSTGGAYGVDTAAFFSARLLWPETLHRLCLPRAPCNPRVLHNIPPAVKVEWAAEGDRAAESYMLRNDLLVSHADVLIAFPATDVEEARSGTWATIRRARKAGVPVRIYPLNGDPNDR